MLGIRDGQGRCDGACHTSSSVHRRQSSGLQTIVLHLLSSVSNLTMWRPPLCQILPFNEECWSAPWSFAALLDSLNTKLISFTPSLPYCVSTSGYHRSSDFGEEVLGYDLSWKFPQCSHYPCNTNIFYQSFGMQGIVVHRAWLWWIIKRFALFFIECELTFQITPLYPILWKMWSGLCFEWNNLTTTS